VILFDTDQLTGASRNITSPAQVTSLIKTLRDAAPGPLIISIDQEGGRISRLNPTDGFPASESEAQVGAINQKAHTTAWAQGMVSSMKSIGVTMNFAPVVDLNVNPDNPAIGKIGRSFSADPDVVVANATEEIKVHRAAGIKTSIKHFPGFGSATGNTDFDVVDVTSSWRRSELVPFQRLIADGNADSVLVAHLLNRQLDPNRPMSLSHKVVTDLLRGQLGWQGPVVSDDMQAAGITGKYGAAEAFTLGVQAGMDLLVYANQQVYDPAIVDKTLDTAVKQVKSGNLTVAQIEAAARRVTSCARDR
jgi:beta-N-acetylhexosaminidase